MAAQQGGAMRGWRGVHKRVVAAVTGVLGLAAALGAAPAMAARVASIAPQGEVAEVRQVVVRFDAAVVPQGDPRAPAPYDLQCQGQRPAGDARWLDARSWAYDLREPLAAGQRCTLKPSPRFQPLGGAVEGLREATFSTGAPIVVQVQPYAESPVEEDQHFLLQLNGAVDAASVARGAWCEVNGLQDRIPVRIVEGTVRDAVLRQRTRQRNPQRDPQRLLLLACQRALPAEGRVRLVWGPGIAGAGGGAGAAGGVSRRSQRFEWPVRPRFLAESSCERENAASPCMPLRPLTLRFNAPVPRAQALAARLVPDQGPPIAPQADGDERGDTVRSVRFAAPLLERTKFRITLPAGLQDDAGRGLANAGAFPLAVATGPMPPLARFGGAPFGIVEAGQEAMMPLTLRHVQADLAGAGTGGQVAVKRLGADTADAELLRWIARLRKDHDEAWETRARPMLHGDADARRAELPQLKDVPPRATEVVGIPLPQRGYHVLEVQSRILGTALLGQAAPMYARTGALVTNLGVHFKRGRSSSLVWVTTLDRGRPVAGARVAVNDCRGQPLWQGSTDGNGIARIERSFDVDEGDKCISQEGLFVTGRLQDDVSFVFSEWARGIEPWRFDIPLASGLQPDRRAHTVFDRTLLRAGETVSMKHYVRLETDRGLALPPVDQLPSEVMVTHVATGTETRLPLAWPRGARAAETRWQLPKNAALGLYDVALQQGDRRTASGSFRVEAFRVPLVDARLSGPTGVLVAPAELPFAAQLNALAGGPMAAAPVKLSAVLRRDGVSFPGHDDFSFAPAARREEEGSEGSDSSEASRIVADQLAASTDAQGAARLVVKGLPPITAPSQLQAELTFNDPNGEVQTVTQRLRLWPAALVVGLRVPGWTAARGQAGATVVVLSTEGRPLKDRAVEVVGRLHQTISTRKRIVGGFYAYDNQDQVRELGTLCSGRSDAQGRLACDLKLEATGEVELLARARDDAGRTAEAASSVWVSGAGEWWFAQDNDDRIDVLPEQREVQPGQTARLQVRMPFRQATALVTVEREGVIEARVMQLGGREPVIELPIPAAAAGAGSWAPNVMVGVLVLRGRLRDAPWWSLFTWGWRDPREWWQAFRYEGREWRAPTAQVDLAKPAFKLGVAQLAVGLAAHRLDVKVTTDQPQYGVRQTVKALVQVSQGGQPAAGAEIAFAAVDEGLLALQPNASWKLLEGLMQPHPWGVQTATAQGEIIGRRHYGRKAMPPGGGGGRNPTRELFDTLLLWRGTVQLDAMGQARIDVPLNDSLTSFRLVAIADALPDRYGSGSASVRVTQDLQMLSGLPPLVRAGDRFDAVFTLRNTTARALNVKATLAGAPEGAGPIANPPQALALAAGASTEVRWTVAVPEGIGRVDWTAAVEEAGGAQPLNDRLKITQAVLPAVPARVWQATLLQLDGVASVPLATPADALPAGARINAVLQPRLSGALPGLRRYFETYPYTCLEQKASRALALHDDAGWAALRDEAPAYLDADGLAQYFVPAPGSAAQGSDRLTAYLLAAAHEAGRPWPDAAREPMLRGLAAFVEGRIERRFNAPRADLDARKLAALEALARHDRVVARMLGSIAWAPSAWPTSAVLDAWSLYRRVQALPERSARLDELQRLLRSRLVAGGTTLKFTSEADDDWWWLMDGPDANAARLALAAADVPAWKDELPLLVSGALARQRRGAWQTTTANLWGVLALERFARQAEAAPLAGRTTVQLAGGARGMQALDWAATPAGSTLSLPWPAGSSTLQAAHEGGGRPWLSVQALAAVPLKAPLAAGYRIVRSVSAVQRKRPDAWSRGDIVRVRLDVEAATDMSWVVVDDPVPAGATLLGSGLGRDSAIATQGDKRDGRSEPAHIERSHAAWRAYYDWLPRGRHIVEYTMRLNTIGRFNLPPTRVEAMYAPESFGEAPNAAVDVQP